MTTSTPPTEVADPAVRRGRRSRRHKLLAAGAMLGIGFAVAIAGAEWLASGSGSGYAKAGTAQPLTTESATASESLYPGGTGTLTLRVRNPNPFPTTVTSISPNGPITSDSAACDAGGHGVTFAGVTGLNLVVAASSPAQFDLTNAVAMAATSANACQGATFTIPVSLNGGSGGGGGSVTTTTVNAGTVTGYAFADEDGDTFGDWHKRITLTGGASPPPGYVTGSNDCDDTDPNVHPGAMEIVGNQKDDNCNGTIDEGGYVEP